MLDSHKGTKEKKMYGFPGLSKKSLSVLGNEVYYYLYCCSRKTAGNAVGGRFSFLRGSRRLRNGHHPPACDGK